MRLTIALLAGVASAAAAPHAALEPAPGVSRTLEARSTKVCGQWDSVQTGGYTVYQDLWGESSGTGSQCTTVNSASGGSISWSTAWSWSGGSSSVKSYANVVLGPLTSAHALSSLKSIPTKWVWRFVHLQPAER
jgi:xyloglucan-specific endo-beta-1,4-glucanase